MYTVGNKRMRRIIIHGLRPEFHGLVTAINGWATEPTLVELENILANQEELDKQMAGVSVKNDEKALYTKKGDSHSKGRSSTEFRPQGNKTKRPNSWQRRQERGTSQQGELVKIETSPTRRRIAGRITSVIMAGRKVILLETAGTRELKEMPPPPVIKMTVKKNGIFKHQLPFILKC